MSRLAFRFLTFFHFVLFGGARAVAQSASVPGRDLLDFPLGAMGEPQALSFSLGAGFWNPATLRLPAGAKTSVGVSALSSPIDQGVSAEIIAAAVALPKGLDGGLSIARAAVTGIARTETDPQSIGGDIP